MNNTSKGKDEVKIQFYRKIAIYGHSQFVISVPKDIQPLVSKKLYKITLEEV